MRRTSLVAVVVLVAAAAFAADAPAPLPPADAPIGKIAVAASGAVTYDGAPVTIDELGKRLADLKRRNGRIYYYREPSTDWPPSAKQVLDLVIENKLPISLFTKPDYSEYITSDGQTHKTHDTGSGPK